MIETRNIGGALTVLAAGLVGAFGVAMAAVGAHGAGDVRLADTAAAIALAHAPALLGLAALPRNVARLRGFAAALLVSGVVLFSGDLALRFFRETRLFADAAPAGGMALIAGWLLIAGGALAGFFKRNRTSGDAT